MLNEYNAMEEAWHNYEREQMEMLQIGEYESLRDTDHE